MVANLQVLIDFGEQLLYTSPYGSPDKLSSLELAMTHVGTYAAQTSGIPCAPPLQGQS